MPEPVLLLTGFGAFPGVAENPSGAIALALHGERLGPWRVQSAVLPVTLYGAHEETQRLVAAHRPTRLVHLGVASRRRTLCVEARAVNVLDYRVPDNDGAQPRQTVVDADFPAVVRTMLPVESLVSGLRRAKIPARMSRDAGHYVCNSTYLQSLVTFADLRPLFVHVPGLRADVTLADETAWMRTLLTLLP